MLLQLIIRPRPWLYFSPWGLFVSCYRCWSLWTNQRPVSRSTDHSRPIRGQYLVLQVRSSFGWAHYFHVNSYPPFLSYPQDNPKSTSCHFLPLTMRHRHSLWLCSQLLVNAKQTENGNLISSAPQLFLRFKYWLERGRMRWIESIIKLAVIINIQFKPSQAPLHSHSCRRQEAPILHGSASASTRGLSLASRTQQPATCGYKAQEEILLGPSISLLFGKYHPSPHLRLAANNAGTQHRRDEQFCTNNLAKKFKILQNAKMSAQIMLILRKIANYLVSHYRGSIVEGRDH